MLLPKKIKDIIEKHVFRQVHFFAKILNLGLIQLFDTEKPIDPFTGLVSGHKKRGSRTLLECME